MPFSTWKNRGDRGAILPVPEAPRSPGLPALPPPCRIRETAGLGLVLGLAFFIFRNAPRGFFGQDDFGWLCDSRFQALGEYLRCFMRFNPAGTYRPLSQETLFWAGQQIFGMWPPGFHMISLGLHLLGGVCLYRVLRCFFAPFPCLVGTLFYSIHSAHTSSLFWISAAPEPMALVFFLVSLLLFIRFAGSGRLVLWVSSIAAMVLGIMSKESILALPLVLAAYCLAFARGRLPWTAPHFAAAGLYVAFRSASHAVNMAPYPLAFGRQTWENLERYLAWTSYFSDVFLRVKLKWDPDGSYPWIAALTLAAMAGLLFLSKNRRAALLALAWFFAALQPVLHFSGHIYPYYLAPALAAVALLIASAVPPDWNWRGWPPALLAIGFWLWASEASVKREGRWWNERTFVARGIVMSMPRLDRLVPPEHTAFLYGFTRDEFGIIQQDAALKAYGYGTPRFILGGLDPETPSQIRHIRSVGQIHRFHCFLYSQGRFFDRTNEFRRGEDFVVDSKVRLEPGSLSVRAGRNNLVFRLYDLNAPAIDLLYTRDGELQPILERIRPDAGRQFAVPVEESTPRGAYRYCAIRDSEMPSQWFLVNQVIAVE